MTGFRIAAALAGALVLAACAASEPQTLSTKRPVTPPGGLWEVTEALALDGPPGMTPPYLGQRLALFANGSGDPAGRLCKAPLYHGYEAAPALVLGKGAQTPRPVMEVTCEGESFGTYVAMEDGSLKTRVNAWLLTLTRAAAPAAVEAKPVELMPATAPVVAAEPAKPAAAGPLVYLASYKTEATARTGFTTLAKQSAHLARLPAITKQVDLGAKGKWVRLYAQAADAAEAGRLCVELKAKIAGCGSAWAK